MPANFAAAVGVSALTAALISPSAVFYDPATRTFPMHADGTFPAVHPVDQAATLALTIPLGKIKSCPTLGHTFATLGSYSDASFQRRAQDAAKLALAAASKAGDVRFISCTPRGVPTSGRIELLIQYTNLRTSQVQTVSSQGF